MTAPRDESLARHPSTGIYGEPTPTDEPDWRNLPPAGEYMAIRTHDAADPADHQPVIRIVASVEIGGEWVTHEMIAYAARQFADSIAAKLRAAADEAPPGEQRGPTGPGPS